MHCLEPVSLPAVTVQYFNVKLEERYHFRDITVNASLPVKSDT